MMSVGLVAKISNVTVETRIKGPRFFLSLFDRLLIRELVFFIPACNALDKVLIYSKKVKWIGIVSSQEFLTILEKT